MKISMNFSMDQDDLGRYADAADLRHFYESFALSGLEVMPLGEDPQHLVEKDMVTGDPPVLYHGLDGSGSGDAAFPLPEGSGLCPPHAGRICGFSCDAGQLCGIPDV